MEVIRFKIQGFMNSFRIPFFRTYHKTFLAPPKTTVVGMLCNISLKPQKEFFEILNSDKILVSVIINDINGRTKDLWSYKTLEKKNMGKSVVRRDKLFIPNYTIYLKIEDKQLFDEIFEVLNNPKNIPSLGLDDELVYIYAVKKLSLMYNNSNRINSMFLDKGIKYKAFILDSLKSIELPTAQIVPIKFKAFDKKDNRIPKEILEEFKQVEYINCEIEFQNNIEIFEDIELKNKMVFY